MRVHGDSLLFIVYVLLMFFVVVVVGLSCARHFSRVLVFCSILKLNQPLKVLLHFIYGCFFFIFRFFFVCLSLLRVLFIFTFDKEIDNHSKANFVFSLTAWFQTCSIDRARVLLDSEACIRVGGSVCMQFLIMSHSFLNLVSTQKLSNVAFDLHLSYIIVFHEVLSKLSLF